MKRLVCSFFICLAFCVASSVATYDDGTVKCTLRYERKSSAQGIQEGKAVLTVETTDVAKGRPVVSLTSVLDISRSMDTSDSIEAGEKTRLDFIKTANEYVIDRLAIQAEDHRYGSVAFSSKVEELTPLQKLTKGTAEPVKKKIAEVESSGLTDLLGGILHGLKQQTGVSSANFVRSVLVFTDGKPTFGEIQPSRIYEALKEARYSTGMDILIHVIAVGDVNYDLLREITHIGGGDFYHVSNEEDIPRAFAAVLGGLLTEAALNLRYEIKPIGNLEVTDVQSGGAKIEWKGRTAICHLNDMFVEENRAVVITYGPGCPTESGDGIEIRGGYRDPVELKDVTVDLGTTYPTCEIDDVPDWPGGSLPRVWQFRQEIAQKLKPPAKSLEDGDVDSAIDSIDDVVVGIVGSKHYKDPFLGKVVDDLRDLGDQIKKKGGEIARGRLEGLIGVVGGGRPASVDHEMFDTVAEGLTSMQEDLVKESEEFVEGKKPRELFGLPSKIDVSVDESGEVPEYKVKVSVEPPPIKETPPLSLTVVLDRDAHAKDANTTFQEMTKVVKDVIKDLETSKKPDVKLGIVLSSGSAKPVLELTNISDIDVDKVLADIDAFQAKGDAGMADGLKEGLRQQINSTQHKGQHAVLLVTDGKPTDAHTFIREVEEQLAISEYSVEIHTFGLEGSDSEVLKNLSKIGGGVHHDIQYTHDLGPSVGEAVWELKNVKALNAKVVVKPTEANVVIKDSLPRMTEKDGVYTYTFPKVYEGEKLEVMTTVDAPVGTKKLANVTLSYEDVDGNNKTSDVEEVEAKPKGSTAEREVEEKILDDLKPAIQEGVTPESLPDVAKAIYETIPKVKEAKNVDKEYKQDLVDDLETVATKIETAKNGTEEEIRDAKATAETFVETVETQHSKGTAHPSLHTQERYEPPAAKEKIKEYTPPPTAEEKKAEELPEPVKFEYKNVVKEVTTEEQELTVEMEIKAEEISISEEAPSPSSFIILIDASDGTTVKDIQKMKEKTISIWKTNRYAPMSNVSHLEILIYSKDIHPVLYDAIISEIDEEKISRAFNFTETGGKGDLPNVLTVAMKLAKHIQKGDLKHDVKIIPFVGGSSKTEKATDDAQEFIKHVDDYGYPFEFAPVLMKNADATYFDAYPPWVQHCVVSDIDTFDTTKPSSKPIARRVTLVPNENEDVEILDVEGGIKDGKGYALSDLSGKQKRTVKVKMRLPEGNSTQILRMPFTTMWDMRTHKKHTVHGDPLSIPRKSTEEEEKLKEVRSRIRDSALTIDKAVAGENWPKVVDEASQTISIIKEANTTDPEVDLVQDRLDTLAKDIYKIVGEGKDPKGAKILSKSILDEVGEPEVTEPTVAEPEVLPEIKPIKKEAMWPGKKEGPGYPKEPLQPPVLISDGGLHMKDTDKTMKVPMKIRAPQHKGHLVDAQVIILLDGSADADWKHERELTLNLLESLSKRQGKRAVGLWTWNDGIQEIYFESDFGPEDLKAAVEALDAASLGGVIAPEDVMKLIDDIKPIENTVTTVYWMVTTQLPEIDSVKLKRCIDSLKRPKAPTVIVFKPEASGENFKELDQISTASGGQSKPTFPRSPETDVSQRIQEDGWKAVDSIEKTYTKNAKVKVEGKDGAKVIEVTVDGKPVTDVESGIDIPSMKFGDEKSIEVIVDTSNVTKPESGLADVVSVEGEVPYVRAVDPVEINDTISIEILKPRSSTKVDMMHSMRDAAGWDLFYSLGRNKLKKALITAEEMMIQPEIAGLEKRPDMQRLITAYTAVTDTIKTYMADRSNYKAIQNVTEIASTWEEEIPHYSDEGAYLQHKSFPPSMSSKKGLYHPRVTIQTPSWERTLPMKLYDHDKKIISIAAVFDTADHDVFIDDEMKSLMVQKMTVERIVKLFAESEYTIDLQAISGADKETSSLPVKRFDSKNINAVRAYLDQIQQKGASSNLVSSLKTGLPFVQDAIDSERMVFLFVDSASVGPVETSVCEEALLPYITYPINPVKVLTYIIRMEENEAIGASDPISDLTGGRRMYINHVRDILNAVDNSVGIFDLHAARSVRVEVTSKKGGLKTSGISIDGEKRPLGIVGDMEHGSIKTIDLELNLDASIGDEEIFEYTVSYYRPKYKRWFKTPVNRFIARRAKEEVIKQQDAIRKEIKPILDTALNQLEKGGIADAVLTMHKASKVAHRCLYQDDSLIHAIFEYLAKAYEDVLKLSENESQDASEIEVYLVNQGCALGIDVGGECHTDLEPLEYPKAIMPSPVIFVY